jgi:hypothetical protein
MNALGNCQTCGDRRPCRCSTDRGEEFIREWDQMILSVSDFATKWNLPKPEMIFAPIWFRHMNSVSHTRLAPVIIYGDVRVRFGKFEQVDAFRSV